jgi:hypothetical protein
MLRVDHSLEVKMFKTGIIKNMDAIISSVYVALIIGTGVFFAVWLERIMRHSSAQNNSTLDISTTHLLQGQESPQSSATRLVLPMNTGDNLSRPT